MSRGAGANCVHSRLSLEVAERNWSAAFGALGYSKQHSPDYLRMELSRGDPGRRTPAERRPLGLRAFVFRLRRRSERFARRSRCRTQTFVLLPAVLLGFPNQRLQPERDRCNRRLRHLPRLPVLPALSLAPLTTARSRRFGFPLRLRSRGLASAALLACAWWNSSYFLSSRSILLSPKLCFCSPPVFCRSFCSFFSSSLSVCRCLIQNDQNAPKLPRLSSLSPLFPNQGTLPATASLTDPATLP